MADTTNRVNKAGLLQQNNSNSLFNSSKAMASSNNTTGIAA